MGAGDVTDILHRVELHEPEQARAVLTRNMLPWIGEQMKQGRELVLEARLLDDDKTEEQRGYYHVVLEFIAKNAPGDKHPMATWKEYFRGLFLGDKIRSFVNPVTGRKSRRRVRISTEDLGVRGYSNLMEQVFAYAATDLGLDVPDPRPRKVKDARPARKREHIDMETGEVLTA
jgi:hypothetical protein